MKLGRYAGVLATTIVLFWCPIGLGGITNGSFETGNLAGWTYSGSGPDYSVDPLGGPGAVTWEMSRDFLPPIAPNWTATQGDYFASLWSTNGAQTLSVLRQTLTAEAGEMLRFDYFFDFGDLATFPDTATATLSWSSGSVVLFEHNTAGHELGDDENVGWTTISYNLPVAGTYTLAFTTADYDGSFESILGVDNVSIRGVPGPSAILLSILGTSLVGWLRRRRTL
jgi:hypothetical protein